MHICMHLGCMFHEGWSVPRHAWSLVNGWMVWSEAPLGILALCAASRAEPRWRAHIIYSRFFVRQLVLTFDFTKKYKEIETLHENKYRKFSSSKLLQIFWINRVRFPLDFFRRKKLFPCWIWNEALKVARREGARLRALCGLTNDARHVQI